MSNYIDKDELDRLARQISIFIILEMKYKNSKLLKKYGKNKKEIGELTEREIRIWEKIKNRPKKYWSYQKKKNRFFELANKIFFNYTKNSSMSGSAYYELRNTAYCNYIEMIYKYFFKNFNSNNSNSFSYLTNIAKNEVKKQIKDYKKSIVESNIYEGIEEYDVNYKDQREFRRFEREYLHLDDDSIKEYELNNY